MSVIGVTHSKGTRRRNRKARTEKGRRPDCNMHNQGEYGVPGMFLERDQRRTHGVPDRLMSGKFENPGLLFPSVFTGRGSPGT